MRLGDFIPAPRRNPVGDINVEYGYVTYLDSEIRAVVRFSDGIETEYYIDTLEKVAVL